MDLKWFEVWKEYVNYEDNTAAASSPQNPGLIDNSGLLENDGRALFLISDYIVAYGY